MSPVGADFFDGPRQFVKRRTTVRRPSSSPVFNSPLLVSSNSGDLVESVSKRKVSVIETAKLCAAEVSIVSSSKRRRSPIWANADTRRGWLAGDSTTSHRQASISVHETLSVNREAEWSGVNTAQLATRQDVDEDCMVLEEEFKERDGCVLTYSCQANTLEDRDQSEDCTPELHWGLRGQRAHRNQFGKGAQSSKRVLPATVRNILNCSYADSPRPCTPSIDEEICLSRMQEESTSGMSGDFDSDACGDQDLVKKTGSHGSHSQRSYHLSRDLRRSTGSEKLTELRGLNIQLGWHEMMDDFKMCGGRLCQKPKLIRPKRVQRGVQMMSLCLSLANRKLTADSLFQDYEPQIPKTSVQKVNGLRGQTDSDDSEVEM